jgi:hypothetical protein
MPFSYEPLWVSCIRCLGKYHEAFIIVKPDMLLFARVSSVERELHGGRKPLANPDQSTSDSLHVTSTLIL